jgi:hypothetical protein
MKNSRQGRYLANFPAMSSTLEINFISKSIPVRGPRRHGEKDIFDFLGRSIRRLPVKWRDSPRPPSIVRRGAFQDNGATSPEQAFTAERSTALRQGLAVARHIIVIRSDEDSRRTRARVSKGSSPGPTNLERAAMPRYQTSPDARLVVQTFARRFEMEAPLDRWSTWKRSSNIKWIKTRPDAPAGLDRHRANVSIFESRSKLKRMASATQFLQGERKTEPRPSEFDFSFRFFDLLRQLHEPSDENDG